MTSDKENRTMPRNVRNWWLSARIDGRATTWEGGPQARDGGFSLTIKQRDDGEIITAATLDGFARADGTLSLRFRTEAGSFADVVTDADDDGAYVTVTTRRDATTTARRAHPKAGR